MVSITQPQPPLRAPATNTMAGKLNPSLKRRHSDVENEDSPPSTQPSNGKRQRVAFDDDVKIRTIADWNDNQKGIDLVRSEVARAIERYTNGDTSAYDGIRHLFDAKPSSEDAPSSALLRKYVSALTSHVSSLSKAHSTIIYAILESRWIVRSDDFVLAQIRFLGSLCSAQGAFIGPILKSVVDSFTEPPSPSARHASDPAVSRSQIRARAHRCLKYLVHLIPSASGILRGTLQRCFPHTGDNAKSHVAYVKNMLDVVEYAPQLKGSIISLITERLVKIDVQIQTDLEQVDDDIDEGELGDSTGQLLQEDDDAEESDSEDEDSDDEEDPDQQRLERLQEDIKKLDAVLDILFHFYHKAFAKGSSFDVEQTFDHLLTQFDNTIVPTYRSRHTQFLLFHFGQSKPTFIEKFTGLCATIAFERTRPNIQRFSASAYLASFVARGAHVSRSVVRDVFYIFSTELEDMRRSFEPTCQGPDIRRYGAYYALAQALLYIFCFRWRDLLETDEEDEEPEIDEDDPSSFRWTTGISEILTRNLLQSKLNPLKVCSPAIVMQFAEMAHHLHFLYIYSKLETNKRLRLGRSIASLAMHGMPERESALSGRTDESTFQLDAYFPFDPYRLPRSKRWIEDDYVEWKPPAGMIEPEEYESDTEAVEDEEVDEEEQEMNGDDVETEGSG